MSQELTTTNPMNNLPVVPMDQPWGTENVSQESVLIPRLNLMQDLSQQVKDGKCRPGALVCSNTSDVLAGPNEKLEIIPIYHYREWLVFNMVEDKRGKPKREFKERVKVLPENEGWRAVGIVDGKPVERDMCLNFFCLLPSKMDSMPYLISFKRTGMQAGKKLATHLFECGLKKTTPAGTVFNLSGVTKVSEDFSFQAFSIEPARASTIEEVACAYNWYLKITKNNVQVQEDAANA
jgi:hypothetical protein